ncbi:outer membrane protein assembly factor BamC [Simiduia aestuariiviva]|uniref:Outer membrane protein assembly factor BamC n=1 Tax=Simiduia aestuariiviva TaxID=1510459 RepID=A0A839UQ39_9GAMM|nr:outer membrane protein assembly factor BamC [Simiduia aestuariiviva]MBB3168851.1 outer membrane protein assembly factor BamC [Simiduia aestuariiviva]
MIKPITTWRTLVIVPLTVAASGCSWMGNDFRDRSNDYLHAEPTQAIVVPEQFKVTSLDQLYVVPEVKSDDFDVAEEFETPRPQPLASNNFSESVKIQKLGERRWILVNSPPSEVWPRTRNFLATNRIQLVAADAVAGTIDTAWLQFKDSPDSRDRYRIFVEQGVQPDSTELHVRHQSAAPGEAVALDGPWPAQSVNPEREAWMIDELAATLASEASNGATSLLAQNIGGNAKISVTSIDGEPVLRMALTYDRARATIAHALRQEGYTTFATDQDLGIFYVGWAEPVDPEEEGWFSSLFSSAPEAQSTPYSLTQVLTHLQLEDSPSNRVIFERIDLANQGKALKEVPGYLVVVRGTDERVDIRIRDAYGKRLKNRDAKEKLNIIRRNLI